MMLYWYRNLCDCNNFSEGSWKFPWFSGISLDVDESTCV